VSAVEEAVEKVKKLDESNARRLLAWLANQENGSAVISRGEGASAMLGFARRFRNEARSTESWMKELREGEE
jgi:hypothetical protein